MTRAEHEKRREILAKLQARIAADPLFRIFELGLEAGELLHREDEEARAAMREKLMEARKLISLCRTRTNTPCDYTSSF